MPPKCEPSWTVLLHDPAVHGPGPTLLVHAGQAGPAIACAVVAWWQDAQEAQAAGIPVHPAGLPLPSGGQFQQALVLAQKGREATLADVALAWRALRPGGRLVLIGGNDIGITSTVKHVNVLLQQAGELLVNRARGRVVGWNRNHVELPQQAMPRVSDGRGGSLYSVPGAFSWRELDRGTSLLLEVLAQEPPRQRIVDCCSGLGHLAVAAAEQWPESQVLALDADHRALQALTHSCAERGLGARIETRWADVAHPGAAWPCDLLLLNPPHHVASTVQGSLDMAHAALRVAHNWLKPQGRLLLVAGRHLPYEAAVQAACGRVRCVAERDGFKVLCGERS